MNAIDGAVYITMANNPPTKMVDSVALEKISLDFIEFIQAHARGHLRVKSERFDNEDHSSVPLLSLNHGLLFIFDGYKTPATALVKGAPSSVLAHFSRQSQRLGYEILPPADLLNGLAYGFLNFERDTNAAIECLKVNARNYPGIANSNETLGEVYAMEGEKELAIQAYEEALKLDPNLEDAKKALEQLRKTSENKSRP